MTVIPGPREYLHCSNGSLSLHSNTLIFIHSDLQEKSSKATHHGDRHFGPFRRIDRVRRVWGVTTFLADQICRNLHYRCTSINDITMITCILEDLWGRFKEFCKKFKSCWHSMFMFTTNWQQNFVDWAIRVLYSKFKYNRYESAFSFKQCALESASIWARWKVN